MDATFQLNLTRALVDMWEAQDCPDRAALAAYLGVSATTAERLYSLAVEEFHSASASYQLAVWLHEDARLKAHLALGEVQKIVAAQFAITI